MNPAASLGDFVDNVLAGRKPSIAALRISLAAGVSSRENRPVNVGQEGNSVAAAEK
jgi:hypothetical protein